MSSFVRPHQKSRECDCVTHSVCLSPLASGSVRNSRFCPLCRTRVDGVRPEQRHSQGSPVQAGTGTGVRTVDEEAQQAAMDAAMELDMDDVELDLDDDDDDDDDMD